MITSIILGMQENVNTRIYVAGSVFKLELRFVIGYNWILKEIMASGIYRLTFSSGKYYVGKSLDLETRWKQHFNKFATGKAARPMQLEYDRCGLPETEVIFQCHRDHIDILEELLIDQLKGPDMLNTTYPEVNRTDEVAILINNSRDLLHLSTFEHLELLHKVEAKITQFRSERDEAESIAEEYRERGYIINQDYSDLVDIATDYMHEAEDLAQEVQEHEANLQRLSQLSWWDRLFNYKVYV